MSNYGSNSIQVKLDSVDERVAKLLFKLQSSEFEPLITHLMQVRDSHLGSLMTLRDSDELKITQGRAQVLNELLYLVQHSRELLDKLAPRSHY